MPLPKPISVQTVNGLKEDALNYESHKRIIEGFNNLLRHLGSGDNIAPQNFSLPPTFGSGASISAVAGTFKRGQFTLTIGISASANPVLALDFPAGTFSAVPFAQIVQNAGTGTLKFSYSTTQQRITITFVGNPVNGSTYTLSFMVNE